MARPDTIRTNLLSRLSALEKLNTDKFVENANDGFKDRLESTNGVVSKSINDFTSKIKGKTQNKKDIFEEVINTVESFIGSNNTNNEPVNPKEKPVIQKRLLKYAKEAANTTLQSSKEVLTTETKKAFFGTTGICNDTTPIVSSTISMSPKEFDFMNVLKVSPDSITGKLMYENPTDLGFGDIKFNRKLYENFDSGSPYSFLLKDSAQPPLFAMTWNSTTQQYDISGLSSSNYVEFLNNYYNTIEYPDINYVMNTAMQMTLQGDGTEPTTFNEGMKYLNRLLTKLFSLCGSPKSQKSMLNNTPQQISEDEYDEENYFNFDDVEGIDIDDEDSKYRRVLKFRDCNNFEIPVNSNHIEDFSYLSTKKNLDENIENTLNKTASDAYEQSGGSIYLDGFQISLTGSYILKIPKAIMGAVLSPKMIFPIALTYKQLKSTSFKSVKDLMKDLYKLFINVIKTLFWRFIREFWKFVKKDLLNFLKDRAKKILDNKLKRIKGIILSLINVLLKILDTGIQSCTEIFDTILKTINFALNRSIKIPIPGLLLVMSDSLPGFSTDKAYLKAVEKMEAAGIDLNPIYGTENKTPSFVRAIIEGYAEEMDEDSYVKIALKPTTIAAGPGAALITPLVVGVGKTF